MKFSLEISTHDRSLGFDIMESTSLTSGGVIDIPGGARLEFEGALVRKSMGIPELLQFVVDTAIGVEVNLLAAWLYSKVGSRQVEQVIINRRVITRITRDEIAQVIEEEIRQHREP